GHTPQQVPVGLHQPHQQQRCVNECAQRGVSTHLSGVEVVRSNTVSGKLLLHPLAGSHEHQISVLAFGHLSDGPSDSDNGENVSTTSPAGKENTHYDDVSLENCRSKPLAARTAMREEEP